MDEDLERRAGKGRDDTHPVGQATDGETDPSDYADPRVAQPGEDPAGENALGPEAGEADRSER